MTVSLRPSCECAGPHGRPKLIAITGGPGGGKTAVLELVRRYFCKHLGVLPEAASIVFGGGFPRDEDEVGRHAAQHAIFAVQLQLERMVLERREVAVGLCDRGTIDGLAYWSDSPASYWQEMGTTLEEQLARYSAVIHLQSPPAREGYNRSNPVRIESAEAASALDGRILSAWSTHPRRFVVSSTPDFLAKMAHALDLIRAELPPCCQSHRVPTDQT